MCEVNMLFFVLIVCVNVDKVIVEEVIELLVSEGIEVKFGDLLDDVI